MPSNTGDGNPLTYTLQGVPVAVTGFFSSAICSAVISFSIFKLLN
jgi:hypothetical protein